jgi:hypothetical protein
MSNKNKNNKRATNFLRSRQMADESATAVDDVAAAAKNNSDIIVGTEEEGAADDIAHRPGFAEAVDADGRSPKRHCSAKVRHVGAIVTATTSLLDLPLAAMVNISHCLSMVNDDSP